MHDVDPYLAELQQIGFSDSWKLQYVLNESPTKKEFPFHNLFKTGIYLLSRNNIVLYVGQTVTLGGFRKRIFEHRYESLKQEIYKMEDVDVNVVFIHHLSRPTELTKYELSLIREYTPPYNRRGLRHSDLAAHWFAA